MFRKHHPQSTSCHDFETLRWTEQLRQAKWSFNLALAMTTTSGIIVLVLALTGRVQAGTITAIGGLMSNLGCIQLAREASDRLNKS